MMLLGILALILGLIFLGRYFYLKKKAKEEKGFVIIATVALVIWLFGGSGLMILGIALLALLLLL